MRFLLRIIILLLNVSILVAQQVDSLWSRTYGGSYTDVFCAIQQTSDRGFILAGYSGATTLGWLVKTDSLGSSIWQDIRPGTGSDVYYSVVQTTDGGYAAAGRLGYGPFGGADELLSKRDSVGRTIWEQFTGTNGFDEARAVKQTNDGGYILAGYGLYGNGGNDAIMWKTNAVGQTLWTYLVGAVGSDEFYSTIQTADGGYAAAGRYQYTGSVTQSDFMLHKLNSAGAYQWLGMYGGAYDECCYAMQQTRDGGYILAGSTNSYGAGTPNYPNVYLVRTNASGALMWHRSYGGVGDDRAYSVAQTADGGFIVGGFTTSYGSGSYDFWALKVSPTGDSLSSRTYGGPSNDLALAITQTSDQGYVLAGYTYSFGAGIPSHANGWFVKLSLPVPSPAVTFISDVGNDQGRRVRIRWSRSLYDGVWPSYTITDYSIYRRIDQYHSSLTRTRRTGALDWPPGDWEYVMTVPARGETTYAAVVPTLADSNSASVNWSAFFVSAETSNPLTYFDSAADSGYSIDNLAPDATVIVASLEFAPGAVILHWDPVSTGGGGQAELNGIWYTIYGSTNVGFSPSPATLLAVTQNSTYVHAVNDERYFYVVCVSDNP